MIWTFYFWVFIMIMIFLMLILSTAIHNFIINIKLQQIQPQCIMQNKYNMY